MKKQVQNCSIVVPASDCIQQKKGMCPNKCPYCIANKDSNNYINKMSTKLPDYGVNYANYVDYLCYAKENDSNVLMITGANEATQNRQFLANVVAPINNYILPTRGCGKFYNIDFQTSGIFIDSGYARFLKETLGVKTMAISLASLDSAENAWIQHMPKGYEVDIPLLCKILKDYGFIVRICINMNDYLYKSVGSSIGRVFEIVQLLGADQITIRRLVKNGEKEQGEWIDAHGGDDSLFKMSDKYIKENSTFLDTLPYGYEQRLIYGMSCVVDSNSMDEKDENDKKEVGKFFVVYTDGLFADWNRRNRVL